MQKLIDWGGQGRVRFGTFGTVGTVKSIESRKTDGSWLIRGIVTQHVAHGRQIRIAEGVVEKVDSFGFDYAALGRRAVARAVDPVMFVAALVLVVGACDGVD